MQEYERECLDNMKKREISRIKFYRKVVSELMLEFEQVGKVDEDGQRVDFKFKSLTAHS